MGRGLVKFLSGIVVGILIAVLGVGVGAYVLLTTGGMMGKIEESVGGEDSSIHFSDEQKAMSLLEYGTAVLGVIGDLANKPIGEIEDLVGITILSDKISDVIGIEAATIRAATISDIGATIANNLTVKIMSEKFDIGFPEDIPLFKDEEFLNKPVSDAFADLNNFTMNKFIKIDSDSSQFLQNLGTKKLSELSSDMDSIIRDTKIGDVLNIDVNNEDTEPIMIYLKDWKIGELDKIQERDEYDQPIPGTGGAIQNMMIKDAIKITDDSAPVLKYFRDKGKPEVGPEDSEPDPRTYGVKLIDIDKALKDMTIGNAVDITAESSKVLKYLKDSKLDELNAKITAMTISDAVEITDASHAVLKAIADLNLNQLADGAVLQGKIDSLKLGEVITIGENPEPILSALSDTTLGGLNEKIATLAVKDVFKDYNAGILSLVSPETQIKEIANMLPGAVTSTSLYNLKQIGVLDYTIQGAGYDQSGFFKKASTHNSDISMVVGAVGNSNLGQITNPLIYVHSGTVVNTAYSSAVSAMAGYKGSVNIGTKTTVDADGYYVLTPEVVASVITISGIKYTGATLIMDTGIKVKIEGGEDNFDLFSVTYAETDMVGAIKFVCDGDNPVKFETERGGYAFFYSAEVKVNETLYDATTNPVVLSTKTVWPSANDPAVSNVLVEIKDR